MNNSTSQLKVIAVRFTDSQAERVRAAAVKYTPEKAAIKTQKNLKNKGKRKTQILAIHHKKKFSRL